MEGSFRRGCQSGDTIRAVAEECFVDVRHARGLTRHCSRRSGVSFRVGQHRSNCAALQQALHCRQVFWATLESPSFRSALTLLSFVLPDRVAFSQNGTGVRLRTNFAAADCGSVSANWRHCYAVLCASRNSSGRDFVFVHRSGADRCNLFLGIGTETLGDELGG